MIIQVFPEDILWEYVSYALGAREDGVLSHQKYFGQLPREIHFSEEFLERWKKNVTVAVRKKLVEWLGLQTFLVLEADQTRRVSVVDALFWQNLDLSFSRSGVLRLWESLLARVQELPPEWLQVTPADALLLGILDARHFDRYSFDWLMAKKAPWVVTVAFLRNREFRNPATLPWLRYFEKPAAVPLPLREVLIEETAAFFRALCRAVQIGIQNGFAPGFQASAQERRVRFTFSAFEEVMPMFQNDPFRTDIIAKTVRFWANDGTVGLDDGRYIEGALAKSGLLDHLQGYTANGAEYIQVANALAVARDDVIQLPSV